MYDLIMFLMFPTIYWLVWGDEVLRAWTLFIFRRQLAKSTG